VTHPPAVTSSRATPSGGSGAPTSAGPVPASLVTFFQQEATEYLDRLDQVVDSAGDAAPDLGAFLAHARALRGSASMARLDGLADLAATVERVGAAIRDDVVHWDQRLQFAVRGALVEIRALVDRAAEWGEPELRRSRQQSVALGAVAASYMRTPVQVSPGAHPVSGGGMDRAVPIATLFPDDGQPGLLHRGPMPPMTAGQRFRAELAELARPLADALNALRTASSAIRAPAHASVVSAVRALGATAESFGAASIVTLSQRIAAARLESAAEHAALDALVRLLADRTLDDADLAARIRMQRSVWGAPSVSGTPAMPSPAIPAPAVTASPTPAAGVPSFARVAQPTPMHSLPSVPLPRSAMLTPALPAAAAAATVTEGAGSAEGTPEADVVSIDALVLDAPAALARALDVRDALRARVSRSPSLADPVVRGLLDELLDLVALANGRVPTD
jgi:hypothetical protein